MCLSSRKYLLLLLIFVKAHLLQAQIKNKDVLIGDVYFQKGQYAKAAIHYEQFLRVKKSERVFERLSDCYLKLNLPEKAEKIFKKIRKNYTLTPSQSVKYATLLVKSGKIRAAKNECNMWLKGVDSLSRAKLNYLLLVCDSVMKWEEQSADYEVINLKSINTEHSEMAPCLVLDTLVFGSNRPSMHIKPISMFNLLPFYDLYTSSKSASKDFLKPKKISNTIHSSQHKYACSFTKDGTRMYFTVYDEKDNGKDTMYRMKLFHSEKLHGKWTKPMSFIFNDSLYSFAHPSVDHDNKMIFFASDMKGGFGGMDIYVSLQIEDSVWSDPINLGPQVNTGGNEIYPFYHKNGNLYFASDGHFGMGGYDLFVAIQQKGAYSKIENLKPPINSTCDDFGLCFDESLNIGYFTSNRPGGKGQEDIYSILKKKKSLNE